MGAERIEDVEDTDDAATAQYTQSELDQLLGRAAVSWLDDESREPPQSFALQAPPLRSLPREAPTPAPIWPAVAAGAAAGLVLSGILGVIAWVWVR